MEEVKKETKKAQVKKKMVSVKRAFILFWHGLTALLVGMANWITVVLGMKDDSKYGKFLRRTVGSCFAFIMLMLAMMIGFAVCRSAYYRLGIDGYLEDSYEDAQFVSRSVTYYAHCDDEGYLKTCDGKKTITGIQWIAKPLGLDSLVCYSNGKKRGYFNMFTGKPVIEPQYKHAWIFSDGVASVDDGGWIKFIDASGKVVIDPKIPYISGMEGYVFHNNLCIVHNDRLNRFGIIDKRGNWVLPAAYCAIEPIKKFWIVDDGVCKSLLDSAMHTVVPSTKGEYWVGDDYISVTLSNHVIMRYNFDGELINDFYINDVNYLTYETDELRYTTTKNYDENGMLTSETDNTEPWPVEKVAKCRCYEAETGWYGLMTAEGKIITPPSFSSIKAVGYDLYLCKDNDEDGLLLNGKGEICHQ